MEDAVGNRWLCQKMRQVKVGMTPRSEFDLRDLIFVCSVSRCYVIVALTYGTVRRWEMHVYCLETVEGPALGTCA
jgi:hypothetical protein